MSTEPTQQTWKPGDVANGHVLTQHGTWVPLGAVPRQRRYTRSGLWVTAVIVGGGLIALLLTIGAASNNDFKNMTCAQLTAETLKMTGVDATEEYDLDRVRAINAARDDKNCWETM